MIAAGAEARRQSQADRVAMQTVGAQFRAVFLDGGGVIVLPHRKLVVDALAQVGISIEPLSVAPAHYRAVRGLDSDPSLRNPPDAYLRALCAALGVPDGSRSSAVSRLAWLADRSRSGEILWSEQTPDAVRTMAALRRAGIAVLIVTNSDGHAAENLHDAGICQTTSGRGATVTAVIDSAVVGSAKPDPGIFRAALERAQVKPAAVAHVGDMLGTDIKGAHAAGILPIHFDPSRACRARDHRHIRSLRGLWLQLGLATTAPARASQPHRDESSG